MKKIIFILLYSSFLGWAVACHASSNFSPDMVTRTFQHIDYFFTRNPHIGSKSLRTLYKELHTIFVQCPEEIQESFFSRALNNHEFDIFITLVHHNRSLAQKILEAADFMNPLPYYTMRHNIQSGISSSTELDNVRNISYLYMFLKLHHNMSQKILAHVTTLVPTTHEECPQFLLLEDTHMMTEKPLHMLGRKITHQDFRSLLRSFDGSPFFSNTRLLFYLLPYFLLYPEEVSIGYNNGHTLLHSLITQYPFIDTVISNTNQDWSATLNHFSQAWILFLYLLTFHHDRPDNRSRSPTDVIMRHNNVSALITNVFIERTTQNTKSHKKQRLSQGNELRHGMNSHQTLFYIIQDKMQKRESPETYDQFWAPALAQTCDKHGLSLLHHATTPEQVGYLLNKNQEMINVLDFEGRSSAWYALMQGNVPVLKELLSSSQKEYFDIYGRSLLFYAAFGIPNDFPTHITQRAPLTWQQRTDLALSLLPNPEIAYTRMVEISTKKNDATPLHVCAALNMLYLAQQYLRACSACSNLKKGWDPFTKPSNFFTILLILLYDEHLIQETKKSGFLGLSFLLDMSRNSLLLRN